MSFKSSLSLGVWLLLMHGGMAATPLGFVKTTIPLDAPPAGVAFDSGGELYALEGAFVR